MEELKRRGNELYAKGKWTEALGLYDRAMEFVGNDGRARAVLLSNRAACWLDLGAPDKALAEGRAAVPTFERGHVRCGAALEMMPGRRTEALEAYRRAENNEQAAKRIAVLEVPIVVTERGVEGIEQGSLDPRRMQPFRDAVSYVRGLFSLAEKFDTVSGPTHQSVNIKARETMYMLAGWIEARELDAPYGPSGKPPLSHFALQDKDQQLAWSMECVGGFLRLSDVAEDGNCYVAKDTPGDLPVIVIFFNFTERKDASFSSPAIQWIQKNISGCATLTLLLEQVKFFRALLERNAALL
jgi:tetratricopeptide (TPR) repeat protein